jgi:hypothetical protein
VLVSECAAAARRGVEIISLDTGPGIGNLHQSMQDGHSTAGSPGNGLGAVQRICGDGWAANVGPNRAALIVADGLGHGAPAADAAEAAVSAFARAPMRAPATVLEDVHLALRPTRGAAVAIVGIEFERDVALYSSLGNVAASIVSANAKRTLVSQNGTAGHVARKLQEFSYPMPPAAAIVVHSDGLGIHWSPTDYAELWSHDPATIAGVLYRDLTRRQDDATVAVGKRRGTASETA